MTRVTMPEDQCAVVLVPWRGEEQPAPASICNNMHGNEDQTLEDTENEVLLRLRVSYDGSAKLEIRTSRNITASIR